MVVRELDWSRTNPNSVSVTQVGTVVVSTVKLSASSQSFDSTLALVNSLFGEPRVADLNAEGNYESIVFFCDEDGGVEDWEEQDFRRYDNNADALIGHAELVERWKNV